MRKLSPTRVIAANHEYALGPGEASLRRTPASAGICATASGLSPNFTLRLFDALGSADGAPRERLTALPALSSFKPERTMAALLCHKRNKTSLKSRIRHMKFINCR
jgi:hypothetical protein